MSRSCVHTGRLQVVGVLVEVNCMGWYNVYSAQCFEQLVCRKRSSRSNCICYERCMEFLAYLKGGGGGGGGDFLGRWLALVARPPRERGASPSPSCGTMASASSVEVCVSGLVSGPLSPRQGGFLLCLVVAEQLRVYRSIVIVSLACLPSVGGFWQKRSRGCPSGGGGGVQGRGAGTAVVVFLRIVVVRIVQACQRVGEDRRFDS